MMSIIDRPGFSISKYGLSRASLLSTQAMPALCSRAQSTRGTVFGMFNLNIPLSV